MESYKEMSDRHINEILEFQESCNRKNLTQVTSFPLFPFECWVCGLCGKIVEQKPKTESEKAYADAARATVTKLNKILNGPAKRMIKDLRKYIKYLEKEYDL